MTYERFSQLWDEIIKNDSRGPEALKEAEMSPRTRKALLAYGRGDKREIEKIKKEFYEARIKDISKEKI